MLTLFLERNPTETQTNGILTMPSGREFYTLECPWRNNEPYVSCIPDGVYLIESWVSPTHGKCYIVSGGMVGKTQGVRAECEKRITKHWNVIGQINVALGVYTEAEAQACITCINEHRTACNALLERDDLLEINYTADEFWPSR